MAETYESLWGKLAEHLEVQYHCLDHQLQFRVCLHFLALAEHNILQRTELQTCLWLQNSKFISILCIRNACPKIICNINIRPKSIRTCSRNSSCFMKSRRQVDLKRSAPDWPKAFWCTYWGPNMEPRVCTTKQVVCEAVAYGPLGFVKIAPTIRWFNIALHLTYIIGDTSDDIFVLSPSNGWLNPYM